MGTEKFILWSRRIQSAVIPILVVVIPLLVPDAAPGDITDAANQTFSAGEQVIAALALLYAGGMGLWSFFRPDGAKLVVNPTAPPASFQ